MSIASDLLAAIRLDPTDDTVRLVLADHLRELDDPADQALGRFIWGGVVASGFRAHDVIEDPLYYTASREVGAVCMEGWPGRWLTELGLGPKAVSRRDWLWDSTHDQVTVRCDDAAGIFTRGLLSELRVSLVQWCNLAPSVLSRWPLERVRILELPGVHISIGKAGEHWCLGAVLSIPRRRRSLFGGPIPAAMIPHPVIVEEGGEWKAEENFSSRAELVESAARVSLELIVDLAEELGDRWPVPIPRV